MTLLSPPIVFAIATEPHELISIILALVGGIRPGSSAMVCTKSSSILVELLPLILMVGMYELAR